MSSSTVRLPRALPLLGHAVSLMRDPLAFVSTARSLGPLVPVRLGPAKAYLVNDPALVRQVLVGDAKRYAKGVQFDKLRPILGNGLVTVPSGEEHRRNRRLAQPAFHHSRIAGYAMTMRDLAEAKAASWHDGQLLAVDRELTELTMRVVGRTLFSTELGDEVVDEVLRSMPTVLGGLTRRSLGPAVLDRLPTPGNRRFDDANRRLRDVVDRIVVDYRRLDTDHGDMVSMLMLARDADTGEGLSDTQIRDEVITMLIAGTETTALVLSWALYELGRRPDLETLLHAEVDAVLGAAELTFDSIGKLAFTRRLISETLRLYPPGWLNTRRTTERVTLGGADLPAGTSILISPYSMQRDPAIYTDPDRFDPDRWLPERAGDIPRTAFIPFSAGTRQCIGESFAWTEAIVVLATIARHWQLRPLPGTDIRMKAGATLAPSELPMTAVLRPNNR